MGLTSVAGVAFQHRPEKGHGGKTPESSPDSSAPGVERSGTWGRSDRALAEEEG